MAVLNLTIEDRMKDEFLNDWKNGEVYLTVNSGHSMIGAKDITFGDATSTSGGRKIEWIPSGTSGNNGSDFEIPVGRTISDITLSEDRAEVDQPYQYATVGINETFTYGGIIRIDKVTITLT